MTSCTSVRPEVNAGFTFCTLIMIKIMLGKISKLTEWHLLPHSYVGKWDIVNNPGDKQNICLDNCITLHYCILYYIQEEDIQSHTKGL